MDESTKLRMNLVAIQKVDPYAKEIIDSCPHVAYYKYINNAWEKTEIEGSFFIYSRVAEPFNSIFINNRLNTNSLVEPITNSIELQSQPPFLLYRNQRSAISGFWFYCKEDCVRIHALLEKLIRLPRSDSASNVRPENKSFSLQQQQQSVNGTDDSNRKETVDIFYMLSKAQAEFTGGSSSGGMEQQFADMKMNAMQNSQPVPQQHPPLMKQLSNAMPDITSPNVVSFFAAAQQPNGVVAGIPDNSHVPKIAHGPIFVSHHSMVQPPVQTVDEIEKLHRVPSLSPKIVLQQQQQNKQAISPQPVKILQQPIVSQQAPKPTLITPTMFQVPISEDKANVVAPQSQFTRPEPLTQNQLLQALNYLLENDPDFIRKIHEAYINSFSTR